MVQLDEHQAATEGVTDSHDWIQSILSSSGNMQKSSTFDIIAAPSISCTTCSNQFVREWNATTTDKFQ